MYIGNVEIHSKLYLAPMAGVTDLAFRQICRELGAGMSCTELVSAKALCYQDKKSRGLLKLAPNEKPAAAQIFGSDIPCMAEAAGIAAEVLTVPHSAIGRMIYESKLYLQTTDLFAWTLAVILLSVGLERLVLRALTPRGKGGGGT